MSPDEELALLITDRLIEAGLIEADRRDDLSAKIAAGTTSADDWRLWIELGPAVRAPGASDAED